MSRDTLELVLVGIIFLVLLLVAPDVLLFGSAVGWWVARRSPSGESERVARAAMFGGAAERLVLLVIVLTWPSPSAGSALLDFLDAMLFSPRLTASSLLFIGMLTLGQALALGYATRVVVRRLSL